MLGCCQCDVTLGSATVWHFKICSISELSTTFFVNHYKIIWKDKRTIAVEIYFYFNKSKLLSSLSLFNPNLWVCFWSVCSGGLPRCISGAGRGFPRLEPRIFRTCVSSANRQQYKKPGLPFAWFHIASVTSSRKLSTEPLSVDQVLFL